MKRRLAVDRGDAGRRLDLVLTRHLAGAPATTRTRMQHLIRLGRVLVNGQDETRAAARVRLGDEILIEVDEDPPPRPLTAWEQPIDVLYEDDSCLAVNKPAGLVSHPTHAHPDGTVLNAVATIARHWPAGERPSLLNRLDKQTSGIMLVARTAAGHRSLQRALASTASRKEYLAVVYGRPPARGAIDLRLRRDADDRRRVVGSATEGASSRTVFERVCVQRLAPRVWIGLLRCRLVTGRTHQIRVHLAASGWPIVGDPIYGRPGWENVEAGAGREALRGFPRQALHAWRLEFPHPADGRRLAIEAPLPEDLARLVETCGLVCAR